MSLTEQRFHDPPTTRASHARGPSSDSQARPTTVPDLRKELGTFLRTRRESMSVASGRRRRTPGLRREDVASRSYISVDYYTRLEQGRARSAPSATVTDAIAAALQLTSTERAHLHRLAGRAAPETSVEDPASALLLILERLQSTPAQIRTDLGTILAHNSAGARIFPWVAEQGLGTANIYERWFCYPEYRQGWPARERQAHSDLQAGELRAAVTRRALAGDDRGYALVESLAARSTEFRRAWAVHRVYFGRATTVWVAEQQLHAHTTIDADTSQRLVVFGEVTERAPG